MDPVAPLPHPPWSRAGKAVGRGAQTWEGDGVPVGRMLHDEVLTRERDGRYRRCVFVCVRERETGVEKKRVSVLVVCGRYLMCLHVFILVFLNF